MPVCPRCHDEYVDDVTTCADCRVELVADDAPLPPRIDRVLGTFDPTIANLLVAMLDQRLVPHRLEDVAAGTRVLVERSAADGLRADLMTNWQGVLASLEPQDRMELSRGRLPGWVDPPGDVWVDRAGRLRVEAEPDVAEAQAADRSIGMALIVAGGLALLYAWYANAGAGWVVAGVSMALLGWFLPD